MFKGCDFQNITACPTREVKVFTFSLSHNICIPHESVTKTVCVLRWVDSGCRIRNIAVPRSSRSMAEVDRDMHASKFLDYNIVHF